MPRALTPLFGHQPLASGSVVQIKSYYPLNAHLRTPFYVRGKKGRVSRFLGYFTDPTYLAVGSRQPPVRALYRVLFDAAELWGPGSAKKPHTVAVDVYGNWIVESEA